MKTLQQHIYENNFHKSEISEKLIINKHYKNNDDLKELLSNVKVTRRTTFSSEQLRTETDVFNIYAEYVRNNNINIIQNFNEYKKYVENEKSYLVIFNNKISEMDIFHKNKHNDRYLNLVIYAHYTRQQMTRSIEYYVLQLYNNHKQRDMHVFHDCLNWNSKDTEYYEISEKTFDELISSYKYLLKEIK